VTNAELRDAARQAISDVMTKGSSYSVDGRSLTRADLASLMQAEKYYTLAADRDANGGITIRAGTPVDA
jgi:hypothetical protein